MTPVRWGVLSTARIAMNKVIPAMRGSPFCEVVAIASRDAGRARRAAERLGIPRSHGSYEALLEDPTVEAVYIPLPNHLHVPWTVRAAEAGKHVLCEKPIALDADEARSLLEARDRAGITMAEAFMVRTHPQWVDVRRRVRQGDLGPLRLLTCQFSYFNDDPSNIRNSLEQGGGGLMDIGCYAVHIARWIFDAEPERVISLLDRHPAYRVDTLASAILDFGSGRATFTCGTLMVPYQRVQLFGTKGRIEVEIPFNAPPGRPCRIRVDDGRDPGGGGIRAVDFEAVDQYTAQGEAVSHAIRGRGAVPVPIEDSIANMAVLDALFRSGRSGRWETPRP